MASDAKSLHILDTDFRLHGDAALHAFCDAFITAYAPLPRSLVSRTVDVHVDRGAVLAPTTGDYVQIHKSGTHAFWHFGGRRTFIDGEARVVVEPTGLRVGLTASADKLRIEVPYDIEAMAAGEKVFHFCRNLAIYLRDRTDGWMLHASAVTLDGKAALFVGDSNAGKSTYFLQSVLRNGCAPLSNDRVFVRAGASPSAVSWPGYLSMCEGTILAFDELTQAALGYERGEYPYATLRWPGQLKPVFTKGPGTKRMYPMSWFTGVAGTPYVREADLGYLVFVRLGPQEKTGLRRIAPDEVSDVEIADILARNHFDDHEPSFSAWHGRPLAGQALGVEAFLRTVLDRSIPIFRLTSAISDLGDLGHLLRDMQQITQGSSALAEV